MLFDDNEVPSPFITISQVPSKIPSELIFNGIIRCVASYGPEVVFRCS